MKTKITDVSIIIVNYNTTALTLACIESVLKFTKQNSIEIILVDNASSDKSIIKGIKKYTDVKFIINKENIGFGKANNIGYLSATGRYIFLLNSDTLLVSDAIAEFWDYMERDENKQIGCCGASLINETGEKVISYGNFPSVLEAVSSTGLFFLYKQYYKKHIHSGVIIYTDKVLLVDYVTGADMFIRNSVLKLTGLFDPAFFMYFEDTELSFRILKQGFKSSILPFITIVHLCGGSQKSLDTLNLRKEKLFNTGRNIFFRKCYGRLSLYPVKLMYALRALILLVKTADSNYYRLAGIILKS